MTLSQIFKAAHQIAKTIRANCSDYRTAFRLALIEVYASASSAKKEEKEMTLIGKTVSFEYGTREITVEIKSQKEWTGGDNSRIYYTVEGGKHNPISQLYEVVSGSFSGDKVEVNNKIYCYTAPFANSRAKRDAVKIAVIELLS